MKKILLFGAGKSATVLISYLLEQSEPENWMVTVVDANLDLAKEKVKDHPRGKAVAFDITNDKQRSGYVAEADIVISLMPPALHFLIAKDCLLHGRHLLTASYIDENMRSIQQQVEEKGLLFLCEMGLDPGIDHMSAKKVIDDIHERGGSIHSFFSHCGGLVAPENDNNPWHYKISWNPRNVVNAGKAGAIFRHKGEIVEWEYEDLFSEKRYVPVPGHEVLCWYPNRDSLSYISTYGLQETETFIRTTLRHPDFIYGWKNLLDLKLTSDQVSIDTKGKSLSAFFREYLEQQHFSEWLEQKLKDHFLSTKDLLSELVNLVELEQKVTDKGMEPLEEMMMVDDNGDLQKIDIDDLKINAAATLADRMHDASLTLKQLYYIGLDDQETILPMEKATAADVLQFCLEKKLSLHPGDRDLVVMLHELEYTIGALKYKTTSTLVLEGADDQQTAMAKTVGLPLGIAAKLLLNGSLHTTGLKIPVDREIYELMLPELEQQGIVFTEETMRMEDPAQ